MTHKLKIGDTVDLGGHEFIFTSYAMVVNREGQQLTLSCMDPLTVLRQQDFKHMQEQTVKNFFAVGEAVKKKISDEGDEVRDL